MRFVERAILRRGWITRPAEMVDVGPHMCATVNYTRCSSIDGKKKEEEHEKEEKEEEDRGHTVDGQSCRSTDRTG